MSSAVDCTRFRDRSCLGGITPSAGDSLVRTEGPRHGGSEAWRVRGVGVVGEGHPKTRVAEDRKSGRVPDCVRRVPSHDDPALSP